jgi:Ca2+-binding RTX toxin-like protein
MAARFAPDNDPTPEPSFLADANYWNFSLLEAGGFTGVTVKRLNSGNRGLEVTLSTSARSTRKDIELDAFVNEPLFRTSIVFENGSIAKIAYSGEPNLTGRNKHDFLYGGDGAEVIDGRRSSDYMKGGGGNDVYIVNNASDFVDDSPETGTETVKASVDWSLSKKTQNVTYYSYASQDPTGIDNLVLTGGSNIKGTGNYLNNEITGNDGNNLLVGFVDLPRYSDGTVFGITDAGILQRAEDRYRHQVDKLTGRGGKDTFALGDTSQIFYTLSGNGDYAVIKDFSAGTDKIQIKGAAINYRLQVSGGNTQIFAKTGNELIAIVEGKTNIGAITNSFIVAT